MKDRGGWPFAVIVLLSILLPPSAFVLVRARVPADWRSLQTGDTIAEARTKVPELKPDSKDGGLNTWYHACRGIRQSGIEYHWDMDVDFDARGRLLRLDGRSYNDLCGILDSRYRR